MCCCQEFYTGQQRLQADPAKNAGQAATLPLATAAISREQMAAVDKARAAAEAELNTINALPATLLRQAFNGEI